MSAPDESTNGEAQWHAPEAISQRIAVVRGQRVLLDSDLAALYGVQTKRFNEAIRRNMARFPDDFVFQLTESEWNSLRSQFATLNDASPARGRHRKYLPMAFTEHGAIMAANLLNSPRAVEVSVFVVRAFIRLRELAISHRDLAERLDDLEQRSEAFSHDTRVQFQRVFDALRELMRPPDPPRRPIGFVTPRNKGEPQVEPKDNAV